MRLGTKTEREAVAFAADLLEAQGHAKTVVGLRTLLVKLEGPARIPTAMAAVGPIQDELVRHGGGKIVAMGSVDSMVYARLSRQLGAYHATADEARVVAAWLAGQAWFKGPFTMWDLAKNWPSYVARSKAGQDLNQKAKEARDGWSRVEAG